MGGNRVSKVKWIRNIFTVWLLTGIWHGANWTFLIWGLLYFIYLMLEKITGIDKKIGIFSYAVTGVLVTINWVIFRADNVIQAAGYLANMFGIKSIGGFVDEATLDVLKNTGGILIVALIGTTPLVKKAFNYAKIKKLGFLEDIWMFIIFALALIHAVAATYTPFIYFNF